MPKHLRQLSDHDLLVAGFTAAKIHRHPLVIEYYMAARRALERAIEATEAGA